MPPPNYYLLLKINKQATQLEIKHAYRLLAKKYHPDNNSGDTVSENYFKEIQQAYSVLSNINKRKKYDSEVGFNQANSPDYYTSEVKQDNTEGYQLLVSLVLAILLLFFIVSYSLK